MTQPVKKGPTYAGGPKGKRFTFRSRNLSETQKKHHASKKRASPSWDEARKAAATRELQGMISKRVRVEKEEKSRKWAKEKKEHALRRQKRIDAANARGHDWSKGPAE